LVVILLASPLRYVGCECLGSFRAHARAHKRVLCPVLFSTLLAAVGHSGAAATVPQLVSRGRRGAALAAHLACRASLFGGGSRGLGRLGGHLVERGAKVVAHGVHTGAVVGGEKLLGGACRSSLPMTWCFCVPFVATTMCREKWRRVEDKRLSQGLEKATIGNPHCPPKPSGRGIPRGSKVSLSKNHSLKTKENKIKRHSDCLHRRRNSYARMWSLI
jgi:hypothetical protein